MSGNKRFFARHAKSSALVTTLAIHGLFLIAALTLVAVNIIIEPDWKPVAVNIDRPRVPVTKLKPPPSKTEPKAKPRLQPNRFDVKTRPDQKIPKFSLPPMRGISGLFSGAKGSNGGGLGPVGVSMPNLNLFKIPVKGEKVFLILDCGEEMMYDEMGGIPAYTIIKDEMVRVLGELGPATLFNVAVYQNGATYLLFPKMVSATAENAAAAKGWLDPLNTAKTGMSDKDVGVKTLGPGGAQREDNLRIAKFDDERYKWQERFYLASMLSMQQQADTVFLFTNEWGLQRIAKEKIGDEWYSTSAGKQWTECYAEAKKLHAAENKKRAERGQPPRVIRDTPWEYNGIYFPDIERPPTPEWYHFSPRDFAEAFIETRLKFATDSAEKSGVTGRKAQKEFSFNVVQFLRADSGSPDERFKKLATLCSGHYRSVAGLDAIKSYVEAGQN